MGSSSLPVGMRAEKSAAAASDNRLSTSHLRGDSLVLIKDPPISVDGHPAKETTNGRSQKTASADSKIITLNGSHYEPGGWEMSHRAVWKMQDANNQTVEMYGTHGHGGKEMKFLEVVYPGKPYRDTLTSHGPCD